MTAEIFPILRRVQSWGSVEDQLDELYLRGGLPKGDATGWPSVDKLYSVAGGQWTLVTGVPGMGKSEWVDALTVNLAERGDWTFGLFSPENFPVAAHAAKLIEKRCRKPFNVGPTDRMEPDELAFAKRWVADKFTWIDQVEHAPLELITTALGYARKPGKKLGIVLDPWNTLDHYDSDWRNSSMTETEYVSDTLTRVTKLLRDAGNANVHLWIIAHPAKLYRGTDGKYPVPTGYDISGSAHWFNKADNIICIHREKNEQTQDVDVHVQKVRFRHIGQVGIATIKYDKVVGRYFEIGTEAFTRDKYADPARFESEDERHALQADGV